MVFLPAALLGWYLLQQLKWAGWARIFLVGMFLWFYGYYNVYYLWILIVSVLFNFICARFLSQSRSVGLRKVLLLCGIAGNLALLFYFKYIFGSFRFILETLSYIVEN